MKKNRTVRQQKSLMNFYINDISIYPLLLPEEEIRLGHLIQQGDQAALRRLVEANLRFVIVVAKKYHGFRLSLLDLIHEGNLGLIEAAKRFDPSRKLRFLTYAVWWIRQAILSAISNNGHPFRIPIKVSTNLYRMNRVMAEQSELGPQPTLEDLTLESGLTAAEIQAARQAARETVSLHQPVHWDSDQSLEEVLADNLQSGLEQKLMDYDLKRRLKRVVDRLTAREQQVISWRFGLDGEEPRTLQEIGDQIGVSRERIRQIQVEALQKLRNTDAAQTLAIAFS